MLLLVVSVCAFQESSGASAVRLRQQIQHQNVASADAKICPVECTRAFDAERAREGLKASPLLSLGYR